ncbi:MAG: zinc ribbon domain-containing protein [Candidatus Bathyarchaeia archaeon]
MKPRTGLAVLLGIVTCAILDLVVLLTAGLSDLILISPFLGGLVAGSFFIEPLKDGGKIGAITAVIDILLVRQSIQTVLLQMGLLEIPPEISEMASLGLPLLLLLYIVSFLIQLGVGFGGGFIGSYIKNRLAPPKQPPPLNVCPYCKAKIPLGAVYCPYCGAKLKESRPGKI